jgi:hypothetical protein
MLHVVWLLALSGCAIKTKYEEVNPPPHAMTSKEDDAVEVLTLPPSRAHVEVGTVIMYQSGPGDGDDAITAALRRRAARQGCDAVVLHRRGSQEGGGIDSAACLVYTDGAPKTDAH